MDYEFFAIVLLMLGFVLIVAEVFIPSGGMILMGCAVAMLASFWCAYKAWYGENGLAFGAYIASVVVLVPTVVIGAFKVLRSTAYGRALIGSPTLDEVTPYVDEQKRLSQLVGQIGRTITPLTPGGMVKLGAERLHAFSEGLVVERDVDVEVIGVRGNRILVRPAKESSEARPPPESADELALEGGGDVESTGETPLDFTVP